MKIDKYTTYSCEEIEDASISANNDGTFEIYGFDGNGISFEDLKRHKQFLDYVFEIHSPSIFADSPWDDQDAREDAGVISKSSIPTYTVNSKVDPVWPTRETMFG